MKQAPKRPSLLCTTLDLPALEAVRRMAGRKKVGAFLSQLIYAEVERREQQQQPELGIAAMATAVNE